MVKIKPKSKKKLTIQEEIEEDYQKLVEIMDKIFEKRFGKMCPDFESGCVQCSVHLVYNNFKKELYDIFVK